MNNKSKYYLVKLANSGSFGKKFVDGYTTDFDKVNMPGYGGENDSQRYDPSLEGKIKFLQSGFSPTMGKISLPFNEDGSPFVARNKVYSNGELHGTDTNGNFSTFDPESKTYGTPVEDYWSTPEGQAMLNTADKGEQYSFAPDYSHTPHNWQSENLYSVQANDGSYGRNPGEDGQGLWQTKAQIAEGKYPDGTPYQAYSPHLEYKKSLVDQGVHPDMNTQLNIMRPSLSRDMLEYSKGVGMPIGGNESYPGLFSGWGQPSTFLDRVGGTFKGFGDSTAGFLGSGAYRNVQAPSLPAGGTVLLRPPKGNSNEDILSYLPQQAYIDQQGEHLGGAYDLGMGALSFTGMGALAGTGVKGGVALGSRFLPGMSSKLAPVGNSLTRVGQLTNPGKAFVNKAGGPGSSLNPMNYARNIGGVAQKTFNPAARNISGALNQAGATAASAYTGAPMIAGELANEFAGGAIGEAAGGNPYNTPSYRKDEDFTRLATNPDMPAYGSAVYDPWRNDYVDFGSTDHDVRLPGSHLPPTGTPRDGYGEYLQGAIEAGDVDNKALSLMMNGAEPTPENIEHLKRTQELGHTFDTKYDPDGTRNSYDNVFRGQNARAYDPTTNLGRDHVSPERKKQISDRLDLIKKLRKLK